MDSNEPCLDTALLQSYLETVGKVVVGKMFLLYCQQSELYLQGIEKAKLEDNNLEWQTQCHKMKGAAASAGLLALFNLLKKAETTEVTQAQMQTWHEEIVTKNELALAEFKLWLNEH